MSDAFILDGTRTPWGKYGGSLKDHSAADLAAICMRTLVERHQLSPDAADSVVIGQVLQGGAGMHPARQALSRAGLAINTPATVVNKICGSGLRAIADADLRVRAGESNLVFAGGMESMTNAPYYDFHTRWGARKGNVTLVDAIDLDGLWCSFGNCHMAVYTDTYARCAHIDRQAMDLWSIESQQRWKRAFDAGYFEHEVTPILSTRNPGHVLLGRDEVPRPNTTEAGLERLITVFDTEMVTAGNSPAINDGAAIVLVGTEAVARVHGIEPLARIAAQSEVAVEPERFPVASALAIQALLDKTGLTLDEVEIIEVNEAFAAVPLIVAKELGEGLARANRHGGAIAVGHPIGASGARLALTAALQLQQYGARYAIAAICSGTGQGDAILLERP